MRIFLVIFIGVIISTTACMSNAVPACDLYLRNISFLESRLSETERAKIQLDSNDKHLIPQVVALLKNGNWTAPALNPLAPNYPKLLRAALAAYKSGLIPQAQLMTMILRWEVYRDFKLGEAPGTSIRLETLLDKKGNLTPVALQMFSTLPDFEPESYAPNPALDEQGLVRFKQKLLSLPKSEQFAWVISFIPTEVFQAPDYQYYSGYWSTRNLWTTKAFWPPSLQAKQKVADKPEATPEILTLPSFGATQAYLDARFPGRNVQMIPEFGETDNAGVIEGIKTGGRVFAVHFPEIGGLHQADWPSQASIVSIHDFHHAFTGSLLPVEYRRILPRLAKLVMTDVDLSKDEGIQFLCNSMIPDLKLSSAFDDYNMPLADRIAKDFARIKTSDKNGFLIIIKDLSENPKFYFDRGVNPTQLKQALLTFYKVK